MLKDGDKENVYRVNIDLKEENEVYKKELEAKDNEIRKAIELIDELEAENSEKIQGYESKIKTYEVKLEELTTNTVNKDNGIQKTGVRESLLGEAFGSMILDPAPEENVNDLKEVIGQLERDLEIERDSNQDLNRILDDHKVKLANLENNFFAKESKLNEAFQGKEALLKQTLISKDEMIHSLKVQVENDQEQYKLLETQIQSQNANFDEFSEQNRKLIKQLEMEQNSAQILKDRHEAELFNLNEELLSMKKLLDEENSSAKDHEAYLNLKLTEIANLHKEIGSLKKELEEKDTELTKVKTGLDALAQVTEEQNDKFIEISKELNKKNLMYDRLVSEYEIAKAKVRKYRSEKHSRSSTSSLGHHETSQFSEAKTSYLIKQGAQKALEKAKEVYNDNIKKMEDNHSNVIRLMQKRLQELAYMIEEILNNGHLDISQSVRETLQMSLNDSRRLSKSMLDASKSFNVTLEGELIEEDRAPYVEVNLEDLELEINDGDLDNVINDMKVEHEGQLNHLQSEFHDKIQTLTEQVQILTDKNVQFDDLERNLVSCTEKIQILESDKTDLRIKVGNMKEKIRVYEEENAKLKDRTKALKELSKIQNENVSLKSNMQSLEKEREVIFAEKQSNDQELEDLRKKLKEALDKLAEHNKRKEELDKVLRKELAKTHSVLKRTKHAMDKVDTNKENI